MVVVAGDYPAPGHMMLVFVQQLVHAMIGKGARITVVAPQSIVHALVHREKLLPQVSKEKTDKGISYLIYRPYIMTLGNHRMFQRTLRWINNHTLSKTLGKLRPDILYCHFWSSAQLVSKFAARHCLPLFVACGEGDNALEDMVKQFSFKELTRLRTTVTGVISVSSENARKCIEYNLANKDDIIVLPNCVDTDLFKKKDASLLKKKLGIEKNDFIIAFVGGFIPRKGPDRVADAIKLINDPSIKSIFIGRPFPGYPYDFDCPGIVYKGLVNHDDLPYYLSCSDIFVLPTRKEGCCNAIVEALAMGLPVISSDGPFNDDILDELNSIRINPNNVRELAEAIMKLRSNRIQREAMSKVSLNRNDRYSVIGRATNVLSFIVHQVDSMREKKAGTS